MYKCSVLLHWCTHTLVFPPSHLLYALYTLLPCIHSIGRKKSHFLNSSAINEGGGKGIAIKKKKKKLLEIFFKNFVLTFKIRNFRQMDIAHITLKIVGRYFYWFVSPKIGGRKKLSKSVSGLNGNATKKTTFFASPLRRS